MANDEKAMTYANTACYSVRRDTSNNLGSGIHGVSFIRRSISVPLGLHATVLQAEINATSGGAIGQRRLYPHG